MKIPSANLLKIASRAIGFQSVFWYSFKERKQNGRGQWITTYNEPILIKGSFQPASDTYTKTLGLDETKRYYTLYSSHKIDSTQRAEAPDYFVFSGRKYEVVSIPNEWIEVNGWRGVLVVDKGVFVESEKT